MELLKSQNRALVARLRNLKEAQKTKKKEEMVQEAKNNNAVNLVTCFTTHLKKVLSFLLLVHGSPI